MTYLHVPQPDLTFFLPIALAVLVGVAVLLVSSTSSISKSCNVVFDRLCRRNRLDALLSIAVDKGAMATLVDAVPFVVGFLGGPGAMATTPFLPDAAALMTPGVVAVVPELPTEPVVDRGDSDSLGALELGVVTGVI